MRQHAGQPIPFTARGLAIVSPSDVDPHRWNATGALNERGLSPLDANTRQLLQERRWRKSPGNRWLHRLALIAMVLLHGLFGVSVWWEMRPPANRSAPRARPDRPLEVRFIPREATPVAPAPPELTPPPRRPAPTRPPPHREPPAKDAMTVQLPASPAAKAPVLFDRDGQPLLPANAASSATVQPGYIQRMPQGDSDVMRHANPAPYQPTRFAEDWGKGGGAVTRALTKAVKKTTVKTTIRLPRGVRIHCAVTLLVLAGGCGGDPPSPPSKKDGDERLSMAPPPLAIELTPPAHDVADCIARYRAGEPLPQGCPVDTPNRAVDDELRDCIAQFRAGKRLNAQCPADTATRAAKAAAGDGHGD